MRLDVALELGHRADTTRSELTQRRGRAVAPFRHE